MENKNKVQLLASSPSLEGLTKLLNKFLFSTTYNILDDFTVVYSKGINNNYLVKQEKTRYKLYIIN